MPTSPNLIFKYTIGEQDTTQLSVFAHSTQFDDMLWMAKLSMASFHRWFPDARFLLMVNAFDFELFKARYEKALPALDFTVELIWQRDESRFHNPYHFPCTESGVWWKWIPFRYDPGSTEIAVDTDIICIGDPLSWKNWVNNDAPILVAPERFYIVSESTCGNMHSHPVLKDHKPINCGVVGQKAGYDFSSQFFDVTKMVKFQQNNNARFIDEQGCINVWARQLEQDHVSVEILDFNCNTWMRDFIFYLSKGVAVETVHAVAWYKKLLRKLREPFEKRVCQDNYSVQEFIVDILACANLNNLEQHVLLRQFDEKIGNDDYLVRSVDV